ncbi:MAG: TonB-dependent receptor [Candidatus Dormibacteraeota bacterium]|nr:TonB-dependent receptor [Candidatus Dormibacteraeota bacterium]
MSTGLFAARARAVLLNLLLVFFSLLCFAVAHADDGDELQPVVITATRTPMPILDVASSITVVTAADIAARQERTFADVLKDIPGVNVVQTGGPGGETSVFMRGTNSNHTKVLIDGIDVSDPSNATGAFDFGQLLTQDIERVEVLRGPQSGLYGSDAVGGVINIITKSGNGPAQFSAAIEGGTFDTFNQAGTMSGSQDALHYSASVSHFHAGETPVTPLDLLLPGEVRNDDYDDNLTLSTKLGYDVTQNFDLGLVARYTDIQLHTTGEDYLAVPPYSGYPAPEQSTAASDEYAARLSAHLRSFDGILEQTVGLAYTHDRTDTVEPETPSALNTGERRKADWQGDFKAAAGETVVAGAEYERDAIDQPIAADVHISSGYAELQSHVGEHWYSALNVRYDDNSRFGGKRTGRFAPEWVIDETGTKLHASIGTGFKAPTLSELYQSFPVFFFYANPNLKPESSTGWDAGIEQALVPNVLRLGVTYYYNRIHDLITGVPDPAVPFAETYGNVGRATTDGIESFIAYQPLRTLTLRIDYTYTEAEDDVAQQPLLRRPKHRGTFIATWQATAAWQWTVNVLSVGDWVDVSRDGLTSGLEAPGYTTVNLATSYDLTPRLALFGRVDNLLDRHYENPLGFLQPSIGIYAGVKLKL